MNNIPKIKALVPMKGNSERVPNKNLKNLNGKPLFHWILESLSKSNYIDEIIINTDSEEIATNANENFDVTILERPEYLLGDMVGIQPLIEHDISKTNGEFYLQTHSTNPLLTTKTIDKAILQYFEMKDNDTLFSVTSVKSRFYWESGEGINHNSKILIRTQDLKPIYEENSCFYIFSKEVNYRLQNRIGSNPLLFPINRLEATDIDEIEDFYWAEFLIKNKYVD